MGKQPCIVPSGEHLANSKGFSPRQVALILASSVIGCLLFDAREGTVAFLLGHIVLGAGAILTLFARPRHVTYLLLFFVITSVDVILSGSALAAPVGISSLWRMDVRPFNPSHIFAFFLSIGTLKVLLAAPKKSRWIPKLMIVYFGPVMLLTSLVYGTILENFRMALADMKFPVILLLSLVLFVTALNSGILSIQALFVFVISVLAGRCVTDFLYFIFAYSGIIAQGSHMISTDSAKGTVVVLLFYGLYCIFFSRPRRVLLGSVMTGPACVLIIVYFTRLIWLGALLGVLIMLLASRGFRERIAAFAWVGAVLAGAGWLVISTYPSLVPIIRYRAEGLNPLNPDGSVIVRMASIENALRQQLEHGSLLWGEGYGSWYTERFAPFPLILYHDRAAQESAFQDESFQTGRFYGIHNFFSLCLFKYGMIGLGLILFLWVKPTYSCFLLLRRNAGILAGIPLALVASVPVLHDLYWSGKGAFLSGVFIAILRYLATFNRSGGFRNSDSNVMT